MRYYPVFEFCASCVSCAFLWLSIAPWATWTTTTTSPPAHLLTFLLKLLPLLRCQHLLQTRVCLPSNLFKLGFRLAPQRSYLLPRVAEY